MEITGMTFVTLGILIIVSFIFAVKIISALGTREKWDSTLNEPLKNKNKPWYW